MKNKAASGIMLTLLILCVLSINITGIAVAAPEHDVAVKQISAPSKVALGSIVPINVEIANEGGFPEIVHVTVYIDSTYLDSQDVTLPVAELKTVSFNWDTTGMAQDVYVLNATVTIPEDGDSSDNWKTATILIVAHDVAVTSILVTPDSAIPGDIVYINVTAANIGAFIETASVTILYDATYIDSQNFTLPVAELRTVSFSWNTTGIAEGICTINATATIPGDGDPTDNWKTAILIMRAPTVVATADVVPNTLNLKSKGKWITAYIQLPEGYSAEDVDATSILLNETISPVLDPKYEFVTNSSEYLVDHNEDGVLERMVRFDKAEVIALLGVGEATLTITGEVNGTSFEGSDSIRVILPSTGSGGCKGFKK